MAFAATKATAAMAGAWTGLGMSGFYAWTKQHPWDGGPAQVFGFVVVLLVFFFVPVLIFVFGPDDGRFPVRKLPQVALRGVFWMLSASLVLMVGMPLVGRYAS